MSAWEDLRQVKYLHAVKKIPLHKITLITPYAAQVALLQERVKNMMREEFPGEKPPEVTTVDTYQGGQNDAVIYDPVRSNSQRRIGFVNDLRRLNDNGVVPR